VRHSGAGESFSLESIPIVTALDDTYTDVLGTMAATYHVITSLIMYQRVGQHRDLRAAPHRAARLRDRLSDRAGSFRLEATQQQSCKLTALPRREA
jgi:hypothetical protein